MFVWARGVNQHSCEPCGYFLRPNKMYMIVVYTRTWWRLHLENEPDQNLFGQAQGSNCAINKID